VASPWPVEVLPLKPVACGAIVWRMHGALRVTVVIKAAFGLIHEREARLIAPTELVRADRQGQSSNGVEEIFELAPYLPSAGVIVSGHACAPAGGAAASTAVRVILFRDDATVLDKTLHIFGDRDATPAARPLPFAHMPLVWERTRAYGGPGIDDNPVGVGSQVGARAFPNIVDAVDPRRPAGFGPIGARWPARARLLGGAEPPALDRGIVEIPEDFDWRWFHAAPADQQIDFLTGDEWIALDGMHPSQPRLQSRLPQVRAEARWYQETSEGPTEARAIELGADTLTIDADRQTCWVLWRGHFAVDSVDQLPWIRVQVGVELPGYPISWPELAPPPVVEEPRRASAPTPAPVFADEDRTAMVDLHALAASAHRPIAPFALAEPGARAQPAPAGIPGAPSSWMTPIAEPAPTPGPVEEDTAQVTARREIEIEEVDADEDEDPNARTSQLRVGDLQRPIAPFALAAPGARSDTPRAAIPGAPWSPWAPAPPAAPFDPAAHPEPQLSTLVFSEAPRPPPTAAQAAVLIDDDAPAGADEPLDPLAMTAAMRLPARAPAPFAPFALAPAGAKSTAPSLAAIPGAPWALQQPPIASVDPVVAPPMVAPPMVAPPMVAPPMVAPPMVAPPMVAPPIVAPPTVAVATVAAPTVQSEAAAEAPMSPLRAKVLARLAAGESFDDQDLSRGDLRDLDFHGRSLIRCNLRGSTLTGCNFDGARLEGAQLGEADLTGASLVGAELARADLSKATVARARFDRARLTDAKLASAEGKGASFHGATGQRTSFARGSWDGAVFDAIDIVGADFTGARLDGASFRAAAIHDVRLAEAAGEGAIFDDARLPDARAKGAAFPRGSFRGVDAQRAAWGKARLDGARFDGANLRSANFTSASCVSAGFAGADLGDATLQETAVEGASFASANLRNARMDRIHGAGVDLAEAALDGAELRNARLLGASFAGAALRKARADHAAFEGASFAASDLTEASLRAAVLCRTNLTRSILRGADLRDANLDGANVHQALREGAKMAGASTQGLRDEPEPEK
jgi:uncharacterized protein YjbI with pentapeptide repeats